MRGWSIGTARVRASVADVHRLGACACVRRSRPSTRTATRASLRSGSTRSTRARSATTKARATLYKRAHPTHTHTHTHTNYTYYTSGKACRTWHATGSAARRLAPRARHAARSA
eukprot:318754-Pleurochrysis_carterae.AAC.1